VFAQSADRVAKERAMRRRQLKWLWARLEQLRAMRLTREELLMKLGAARQKTPTASRLVTIEMSATSPMFSYRLDRNKLRVARRGEGRYLLRTNLTEHDPAKLWTYYLQLVTVEEAFKNLKGDLAIRPIFHQDPQRIEAHIFITFLAYCLHLTLKRRLHALAPGLTPRRVLEKFAAMQMIDVYIPTTDARELLLTRYTDPEPELRILSWLYTNCGERPRTGVEAIALEPRAFWRCQWRVAGTRADTQSDARGWRRTHDPRGISPVAAPPTLGSRRMQPDGRGRMVLRAAATI
jgi:hypothetical protein